MHDTLTTAQRSTLAEAVATAALRLGLTPTELRDITHSGDDAALMLIRCERALATLTGGDEAMRHWMRTANRGAGGVPAELVATPAGLRGVVEYLESLVHR